MPKKCTAICWWGEGEWMNTKTMIEIEMKPLSHLRWPNELCHQSLMNFRNGTLPVRLFLLDGRQWQLLLGVTSIGKSPLKRHIASSWIRSKFTEGQACCVDYEGESCRWFCFFSAQKNKSRHVDKHQDRLVCFSVERCVLTANSEGWFMFSNGWRWWHRPQSSHLQIDTDLHLVTWPRHFPRRSPCPK